MCKIKTLNGLKIKENVLVELLYKIISKYDGYHDGELVKKSIIKTEEYKELSKYLKIED